MKRKTLIVTLCLLLVFSVNAVPVVAGKKSKKSTPVYTVSPAEAFELDGTEAAAAGGDPAPFNVDMIDVENVANDGTGVYIAVLDTGLPDFWPFFLDGANVDTGLGAGFSYHVAPTYDPGTDEFTFDESQFNPGRGWITDPFGSGHGLHVTSIITGYDIGVWIGGVAPGATIIPVLVLDMWWIDNYGPAGEWITIGSDRMVAEGIDYVTSLKEDSLSGSPVIISMSLGGDEPSPMIEEAIENAIDAGVIVVASAGNAGEAGMGWPGAYPQVISVAAGGWTLEMIGTGGSWWISDVPEDLKTEDPLGNNHHTYLTFFSARASKALGQSWKHIDVCAPGAAVVGPFNLEGYFIWGYFYVWGTSQAAPHVSGIAALLLQSYPDLDQGAVERILKHAARGLPLSADGATFFWLFAGDFIFVKWNNHDYGTGFLQADAAMKSAARFAP